MNAGYNFQTVEEFLEKPAAKVVVLRHDSDIWPGHDLNIAKIENKYKVKATYYFRIPYTFNIEIIKKIRDLGHEIGYHYENLADAKGDFSKAIKTFEQNLEKIRQIYFVRTVAMHGRPLSTWDSRLLWEKYSLAKFGLIGEPYITIDYRTIYYLTDNGSCWDGEKISIRDTVHSNFSYPIRTTFHLIEAFNKRELPDQIIINAHAARWNDNLAIWIYRYFLQKVKNIAKYFFKILFH
jgi:hypothetical protein